MSKEKEVTIYDIANKLQISAATVSRALQDHPAVANKTKKKISELAFKMGYRSNQFARNLRQQQTKTIGIILHELKSSFITSVLAHSSESAAKEKANAKNLFHKRVDGLIASLAFDTTDLDHFKPFLEKKVPVIFFDRVEQDGQSTVVVIDNAKCGYIATQHLIEQGCKRIAHITSSLQRNVYSQRYKGYKDALFDKGIALDESLVIISALSEEASVDAATQITAMDPLPDGIFITNDFVAAVCIRTLKEHGIRVPEDIAIVGFNNDAIGKLIEPALTTIEYPGVEMGEIVARNLINHLKGISTMDHMSTIIVRSQLIIRESSLKKHK